MEQNHMLPRPAERPPSSSAKQNLFASPTQYPTYDYAPPSYAQTHEPSLLKFPPVPSTELAPILPATAHNDNIHSLPSLSALTGSRHQRLSPSSQPTSSPLTDPAPAPITNWPSLNPLTAYYTPGHAPAGDSPAKMDVDVSSNSVISAASPDRFYEGRGSSVSLDDPDVRMAAEALGDLRADFVNSPPNRHTPLPVGSPSQNPMSSRSGISQEPLISLLTTSHPLLATTIGGATSAYNNSKNFSPRFKSSAEYVEGYLTPIANTVGSVGRVTGVEGGVRWFLGAGRRQHSSSSDLEAADGGSHKRRKVDNGSDLAGNMELDQPANTLPVATEPDTSRDQDVFKHDRRLSRASTVDTLPAYDELRSPDYLENEKQLVERPSSSSNAAWQSRLIMSTSGLSVAMSAESLRSLKYCLRWLRWANEHIGGVISSLKTTLEQYEKTDPTQSSDDTSNASQILVDRQQAQQERSILAAKITSLKNDVLKTLRDAIETVSKYAGGALPDNARTLVRRHLTSLPQRFKYATMVEHQQGEKGGDQVREQAMREGAYRVLVLAKEGLDMMAQVSGVVDGTIVSAEEWCDRLGKKKSEGEGDRMLLPQTEPRDIKTG